MSDPTPQDFADDIDALWEDEKANNSVVKAALANPLIERARPEQIAEMFFGIGVAVVLMTKLAAKVEAVTSAALTPEAAEWADDTMLSLEAGNAEPTPEQWASMKAMGLEYPDYIRAYGRAAERIDAHVAVLQDRLGGFTPAEEREVMAPRACLAVALSMLTVARLDAQNARAERDRADQGNAREVKLARGLLAWKRIGDRGFGPPERWKAYEWNGYKLDMKGCEEYFSDLAEAEAVKTACVNADGLAEQVIAEHMSGPAPEQTYTLRPFDIREHMWDLDGDPDDEDGESSRDSEPKS